MSSELSKRASAYFQEHLGVSFDALTAPIDVALPAGKSLRGSGVYSAIEQARRQDDPSLPMGAWEHDLKRADWEKVSAVAVDALVNKSKDLQIAAWLLEARINTTGFAGIAACVLLMQTLCEGYWEDLHPQAEDGDLDYRANIVHWTNEKLLPALRTVPLIRAGREHSYSWADWEQARRNEQVRASVTGRDQPQLEGATIAEIMAAVSGTSTEVFLALRETLTNALEAIAALGDTLDARFDKDAPSLMTLADLLEQIRSLAESELHKRGVRPELVQAEPEAPETDVPADTAPGVQMQAAVPANVRDRAEAYARLNEAAEFLMRLEPHSPVPYLVKRATEWGRLNTVELYQELFLNLGGQLNIFEMLGLDAHAQEGQPG